MSADGPPGTAASRRASGPRGSRITLQVLWVATKSPWPPRDGGRLLQWETLRALAATGEVEVDVVAPVDAAELPAAEAALSACCHPHLVEARPRPLALATLRALVGGEPVTAMRHTLPAVSLRALATARQRRPHVVHAEQVQAMPQALAAAGDAPILLRAQNVESELWRGAAATGTLSRLGHREAARLARWEGEMVRRAARTLALSTVDAARLSDLAGGAPVEVLPAPFPTELPAGEALPGAPAITLLAGAGWAPNRDGAEQFLRQTWPLLHERLPAAQVHVFGEVRAGTPGATVHAAPADATAAFARDALMVVPLAVASGVRMKILDAWARGVPVVATPAAAHGLDATPGEELLVAEQGEPLAAALASLAAQGELRDRLRAAGRARLRRRHDPERIARDLLHSYFDLAADGGW